MPRADFKVDPKLVGLRLAQVRTNAGMSQVAFAEALGTPRRSYVHYEHGDREAPLGLVKTVHDRFGVDFMWLMTGVASQDVAPVAGAVDFQLIVDVMDELDRQLDQIGRELGPADKARLLKALYKWCGEKGRADRDTIASLLEIAVGR